MTKEFKSNLIDLYARETYAVQVIVEDSKIKSITKINETVEGYILPGFVDAHVHVESSMLVPSEFAKLAVVHGTVATISDPHEIANVLGMPGVDFMIENGKKVPFHFFFGAPSCVPATNFETAGANIDAHDIEILLKKPEIVYLAEMMNYPGVIFYDKDVHAKLEVAKRLGKPIDGHAPGLMGEQMRTYFKGGDEKNELLITTDHECFKLEEAEEKLALGVKIMIREGSAAKNFEELIPLLKKYPKQIMFCCDDKHPDSLIENHINSHVKRALHKGHDLYDVLRASSINVMEHYNLPVGKLQQGDSADFIVIDSIADFNIIETYIKGQLVAENGISLIESVETEILNNFNCLPKQVSDFAIPQESNTIRVIEALEGQLVTNEIKIDVKSAAFTVSNTDKDVLKIAVVNRYENAPVAIAFIKNFELKHGAIASCVAHDCHNIVVVGTNDEDMCKAVNLIIENKGGISLSHGKDHMNIPLPIAGIMTNKNGYEIANEYIAIDKKAKELGTTLRAPFMTLSFMALLVIPKLKLSDKGLFDGETFQFTNVFVK
ncbi:MAG: adenine deaminase [Bacteroidetes bacterium]|nr:adenine deaminase [Bacteroidota bacterium]